MQIINRNIEKPIERSKDDVSSGKSDSIRNSWNQILVSRSVRASRVPSQDSRRRRVRRLHLEAVKRLAIEAGKLMRRGNEWKERDQLKFRKALVPLYKDGEVSCLGSFVHRHMRLPIQLASSGAEGDAWVGAPSAVPGAVASSSPMSSRMAPT